MLIFEKTIERCERASNYFILSEENLGVDEYKKISYLLFEVFNYLNAEEINYKNIILLLKKCNDGLIDKDYYSISDTLRYEIVPILRDLNDMMEAKYE